MLNRRPFPSGGLSTLVARTLGLAAALAFAAGASAAAPANDTCASAPGFVLNAGVVFNGTALDATGDAGSDCSCNLPSEPQTPDVYHQFTPAFTGVYTFSTCGSTSDWDTVISIHSGCPATVANEIACGDQGCSSTDFTVLNVQLTGGVTYLVRVAAYDTNFLSADPGPYSLLVTAPILPVGACCTATDCSVITQPECQMKSGTYKGDNVLCNTADTANAVAYNGAGGSIPDNNVAGLSTTVTVPTSSAIGGVAVRLNNISHTWVGDLVMTLSHGTKTITLCSNVGPGTFGYNSNLNGVYTLADTGSVTLAAAAGAASLGSGVIPAGSYRCTDLNDADFSLNKAFSGLDAAGTWTLKIADTGSSETGSLVSWDLIISPGINPVCTANACPADFNHDTLVDVADLFGYINAWLAKTTNADFNGDHLVDVADLFGYINAWLAKC